MNVLAIDIGASSGRVMRVSYDGARMSLFELHRFPNASVLLDHTQYWNILLLYEGVLNGLRAAAATGDHYRAIGVDAWGNDFVLLGPDDRLLEMPISQRDKRTLGIVEAVDAIMPGRALFARNGVQQMRMNALYQLVSLAKQRLHILESARTLLFLPDYLVYLFTGEKKIEYTLASISQLYRYDLSCWDDGLMRQLGIPEALFPPIVHGGKHIGILTESMRAQSGLPALPVIAVGSHDTASAMAAAPVSDADTLLISSGTWSIMGYIADAPLMSDEAFGYMLSNEGGVLGGVRVVKNIMGLWIFQEIVRCFRAQGKPCAFAFLLREAEKAPPFGSVFDPDEERFYMPGDMPEIIRRYCAETGQTAPQGDGALLRCVFESIALKYRLTAERMAMARGRGFSAVHIVGGGAQNALLSQLTADYLGIRTFAGPAEATTIGNGLVQLISLGAIENLASGQKIIGDSFPVLTYMPKRTERHNLHYQFFVSRIIRPG